MFVGLVGLPPVPNPDEIDGTAFVTPKELEERHREQPFSTWFMTVLDAARPAIREVTGTDAGW